MRLTNSPILVLAIAGCAAGCSGASESALARGQALFASPSLSTASANTFACATCHATSAAPDPSRRLAGYTLYDAAARPSWWGGKESTLLAAVNECLTAFERGAPLAPDDADGRALLVYLESLAPDPSAPALPLTAVGAIDAAYEAKLAGGDPTRGAATYAAACAGCHGAIHTGAGRLDPGEPILPDATIAAHGASGAAPYVVEKVRHGGFFGVGGVMPPYSLQALPDPDLADLLASLGL